LATGPELYAAGRLAIEFQKSVRTIEKRLEGIEPDVIRGKRRFWFLRTAAPAILGITALDPTQQRAALENARTRKIELEIAKLEGDLLDAGLVRRAVEDMIVRTRARLLAIPGAQAGRANPEDPKRAESAIRDGIYDALGELADPALTGVSDVASAAEPNGSGVGGHVPEAQPGIELGAGEVED
jgi:hypothetical protein